MLTMLQDAETGTNRTDAGAEGAGLDWTDPGALFDAAAPFLVDLAVAAVIVFAAWMVSGWIRRLTRKGMERAGLDLTLTRFIGGVIRWAVLLPALLAAMGALGIPTNSFAAILAAMGLAVGLAFQDSLGNLASGVLLLVFRPFKVGDSVNIAGQTGKVHAISLFSTTLDTFDNRRLILPNANVAGTDIENITFHPVRRVEVPVGTDYGADTDQVREVLEKAAENVEGRVTDRDTQVVLKGLGGSSVDWEVRVWAATDDFLAIKQQVIRDVKKALDDAGIGIPFPQMDVHLDRTDQPGGPAAA